MFLEDYWRGLPLVKLHLLGATGLYRDKREVLHFFIKALISSYFVFVTSFDLCLKFVQGFYFAEFHKLVYSFYNIYL